MFKKKIEKRIDLLIELASEHGLNEKDILAVIEFSKHGEYGVAFLWIIDQLYEYDIEISSKTWELVDTIGSELKINKQRYSFLRELLDE